MALNNWICCVSKKHNYDDPSTNLTLSALTGSRKQSVTDAERLFSPGVVEFMKKRVTHMSTTTQKRSVIGEGHVTNRAHQNSQGVNSTEGLRNIVV